MKKRVLYFAAASVATLFLSCNKEQDISNPLSVVAEEEGVMYVQMMDLNLDASTGGPSTRTTFAKEGNGLKTTWVSTDKIGVLIPATVHKTVTNNAGTTMNESEQNQYFGVPLGSPTLYSEGRSAVFSGKIPAYMKISERSTLTVTTTETTLAQGRVQAFYPSLPSITQQAIVVENGTSTVNIHTLDPTKSLSLASQSGTLEGLGDYAVMTATGKLTIGYEGTGSNRILVGSLSEPMQFKQEVAVLHIDHMLLGIADDINMAEGLTLTLSGSGIGKSARFNSSTGQMTVTEGGIVINLTSDDVYQVGPEDWDDENDRYFLPEGCGKVIMHTDEANMDGGTYYLEDMYVAFIPKNFQSGAELSLTATGTGSGTEFQGEYYWNARTAYQAGKVYHLRDKSMTTHKLLSSGSTLAYYDNGYKPLDGSELMMGDEFMLYVEDNTGNVTNASEIAFWSSSDEGVAQVVDDKLICVGDGTAEITAKDKNENTVSAQITVSRQSFSSWDFLTADVEPENWDGVDGIPHLLIFTGESLQLKIRHDDEILNPRHFTWSVDNKKGTGSMTVDENGVVTRQMAGERRITVTDKNGESRSVIVVAQDNSGAVFCDAGGEDIEGTWLSPLVMSKVAKIFDETKNRNVDGWSGQLNVHSGNVIASPVSSINDNICYLTVTKIEDCIGTSDYGSYQTQRYNYNGQGYIFESTRHVFFSEEPYSHSRYLVSYNGPYGKIDPMEINVVHDKISDLRVLNNGADVISPADRTSIRAQATSALGYDIHWKIQGDWSDYDEAERPFPASYSNGWTSSSGYYTSVPNVKLAMKKTGEVGRTGLSLNAWTEGNRTGLSDGITLFPSLEGVVIECVPVKHDEVTDNINIDSYVRWNGSILRIGTGCGLYTGNYSNRLKCAAELKAYYPERSANAWLDLSGSYLSTTGIEVSASCTQNALLYADRNYYSNAWVEAIYTTGTVQSVTEGSVVLTDRDGNTRTITVLLYPNTVN